MLPPKQSFPVLDHGFVRVVDSMGDEAAIIEAARVSYQNDTIVTRKDVELLDFLLRHWHTTPFEMCEIKLHVKLPIFIARQWIRHRTASVNEMSARYSKLDCDFYIPRVDTVGQQSHANKQARAAGVDPTNIKAVEAWLSKLNTECHSAYYHYERALENGVPRELARAGLPVNFYTQWYWKIDLHNLLGFLRLRMDAHAQWEIVQYANVIAHIVQQWLPNVWEAFLAHRINSITFSAKEIPLVSTVLIARLAGLDERACVNKEAVNMSAGEVREFFAKIERIK